MRDALTASAVLLVEQRADAPAAAARLSLERCTESILVRALTSDIGELAMKHLTTLFNAANFYILCGK